MKILITVVEACPVLHVCITSSIDEGCLRCCGVFWCFWLCQKVYESSACPARHGDVFKQCPDRFGGSVVELSGPDGFAIIAKVYICVNVCKPVRCSCPQLRKYTSIHQTACVHL